MRDLHSATLDFRQLIRFDQERLAGLIGFPPRGSRREVDAVSDRHARTTKRRLGLLLTLTAAVLVGGAVAPASGFAALHNSSSDGFRHGIINGGGGGNCPASGYCRAWNQDLDGGSDANLTAGMYHLRGDGNGWNEQCSVQTINQLIFIYCDGPVGTAGCSKYAWTGGNDPGAGMAWHGMNSVNCV